MRNIPGYSGLYSVTEDGRVWSERKRGFLVISRNKGGYPMVGLSDTFGVHKSLMIHRLMGLTYLDVKTGMDIDHIDGNLENNNLTNLRTCSRSENLANRRIGKNNTSGFKGVNYSKYHKKWRVRLTIGRVEIFIGYFKDPKAAGNAYDEAAIKHFGEFALTNDKL